MREVRIVGEEHKELFIDNEFAEIIETREVSNTNQARVYCSQWPNTLNLQIRTFKPITRWGKGKPRNMIANVSITIDEVEQILAFMKAEGKRD